LFYGCRNPPKEVLPILIPARQGKRLVPLSRVFDLAIKSPDTLGPDQKTMRLKLREFTINLHELNALIF
ncbi:MAG TPA: hypothetical protein VGG56_11785, partial [Terracidiphilus sp.]